MSPGFIKASRSHTLFQPVGFVHFPPSLPPFGRAAPRTTKRATRVERNMSRRMIAVNTSHDWRRKTLGTDNKVEGVNCDGKGWVWPLEGQPFYS